jgi:wobble nucleotide-excising tRNase
LIPTPVQKSVNWDSDFSAYRAVFSDRYKALRHELTAMCNQIDEQFGDCALGRLNTRAEQNNGAVEFWSRYCTFVPSILAFPEDVPDAIRAVGQAALAVLERKAHASLEPIQPDDALNVAITTYEAAQARAQGIAAAIQAVNALIAAKKKETGAADVQSAEAELARRRAIKVRHADAVAALCTQYIRLNEEKKDIDNRKIGIRAQLDKHTQSMMKPYERRINHYLDAFNAGFRITETKHGYPGGTAASSYQLVINDIAIDLGDGQTPSNRPSFKNTLSAGDRTTLALAFFFAHLEQDKTMGDKIVVFDDPFSSQDAFRRRQTVHEIAKVARNCAQVIVLSHDATFLKQVWDKAPAAERVALTIADHRAQGSKIIHVDLERACQGRTATDIDDLLTYVTTGAGSLVDLIRKMRVVLETHCCTTYQASFQAGNDWLGDIVRKIREGGDQHPAKDLYDQLDQINDYTSQYHHGEDVADTTPDQIDPTELTGYIRRTLKIVNALQA